MIEEFSLVFSSIGIGTFIVIGLSVISLKAFMWSIENNEAEAKKVRIRVRTDLDRRRIDKR
jgi:hypothetical protein